MNTRFLWIMAVFVVSGVGMIWAGLYFNGKAGTAAGRVVDSASGAPVADAELELRGQFSTGKGTMELRFKADTDDAGHFIFRTTFGGDYELTIQRDGYDELKVPVQIAKEQDNELGDFELTRADASDGSSGGRQG